MVSPIHAVGVVQYRSLSDCYHRVTTIVSSSIRFDSSAISFICLLARLRESACECVVELGASTTREAFVGVVSVGRCGAAVKRHTIVLARYSSDRPGVLASERSR